LIITREINLALDDCEFTGGITAIDKDVKIYIAAGEGDCISLILTKEQACQVRDIINLLIN